LLNYQVCEFLKAMEIDHILSEYFQDEHTFLKKMVETWPKEKEDFLGFFTCLPSVEKRGAMVIKTSKLSLGVNTDCFLFVFSFLLDLELDIVESLVLKTFFFRRAVEIEDEKIVSTLITFNFVPTDYKFQSRIIRADSSLLKEAEKFELETIKQVVNISANLLHRDKNRQFLKEFIKIPFINKQVNFYKLVKDNSNSCVRLNKAKFFIAAADDKFGQVFIDSAKSLVSKFLIKNIGDLVFMVEYGGRKIDRLLNSCKDYSAETVFRLLVRNIKFETRKLELVSSMKQYIGDLKKSLLLFFPSDLIPIILGFF
jgi:hypothetical protein